MKCVAYSLILSLLLSNLSEIFSFCGSKAQNKSYPLDSVVFSDLGGECGCSGKNICIRKCCDVNFSLGDNGTCVFDNFTKLKPPPLYKDGDLVEKSSVGIRFVPGMLECIVDGQDESMLLLVSKDMPGFEVALMDDGRLWMPEMNFFFDYDEYCLEHLEGSGLASYLCFDRYVDDFNFADRLSFIGILISLPFLLATFIVYALLPDSNLHGMSLMCYVFALFMAYFLTAFSYFYTGEVTFVGCRAIGMMNLYFFMASIFWMNVMSFDICSTFSGSRGFSGNKKRVYKKRFLVYSVYAWGVPLLFVALILTLSNTVRPNVWYDPGVRGAECFLRDGYPELLYFYGPLAILITANIVMFIVTAVKIRKIQKDTAMLTKKGSTKHGSDDDKQTFQLYIRLLFAMGLNWSVEIINWAVNWQVDNVPPAIWYVTDFFNALYGVVIFFIFVFKKSIWKQLKKRDLDTILQDNWNTTTARVESLRKFVSSTLTKDTCHVWN